MYKFINKFFNNDYSNTIIKKALIIISSIINSALLNRYLGVELKGEYAVIINYISLFSLILNLGIYHSFAYFRKKNPDKVDSLKQKYVDIFTLQFIIYSTIPLFVFIITGNITLVIATVILPLSVLTGQLGMMMLIENLRYRSALYIFNSFLKLALTTILFLFFSKSIIYALLIMVVYDLFFILFYFLKLNLKPNLLKMDFNFLLTSIKFGFFPMLTGVLAIMNYKFDVIILNQFVTSSDIGLYSTGVALAEYAWMIPDIFKETMFSRTARKDAIDDIKFSLRISTFLIVFIILFIVLFGRNILFILYGLEYVDAYSVTIAIFAGVPIMMYYKILSPLYISKGKTKLNFYTLLVSVILNVVLNFILIPHFGIIGAAVSSVLSYSVCGLIFLTRFLKEYHIKITEVLLINKNDVIKIAKFIKN